MVCAKNPGAVGKRLLKHRDSVVRLSCLHVRAAEVAALSYPAAAQVSTLSARPAEASRAGEGEG
jgi:hypothetical protein